MTDSITQSVCAKFEHRAAVGLKKYGVTMDRDDLTELQWLTHAQEEAMDLVVYLEKLIKRKETARLKRQLAGGNAAAITHRLPLAWKKAKASLRTRKK